MLVQPQVLPVQCLSKKIKHWSNLAYLLTTWNLARSGKWLQKRGDTPALVLTRGEEQVTQWLPIVFTTPAEDTTDWTPGTCDAGSLLDSNISNHQRKNQLTFRPVPHRIHLVQWLALMSHFSAWTRVCFINIAAYRWFKVVFWQPLSTGAWTA